MSIDIVASEPSVFVFVFVGGILHLVFVFDFTYAQNDLGELLMFCARLLSNSNLNFPVSDLSSFLTVICRLLS